MLTRGTDWQEGFVVKHFTTDKLLRIIDILFWGGAHGVGGHTLTVEPVGAPVAEDDKSDKSDTDSQSDEERDDKSDKKRQERH
eukprot:3068283-Prymnesium_polylepis.3